MSYVLGKYETETLIYLIHSGKEHNKTHNKRSLEIVTRGKEVEPTHSTLTHTEIEIITII
jgi:hypothetical protein